MDSFNEYDDGPPPFKVGDIVRLKTGTAPQRVEHVAFKVPAPSRFQHAPEWCVMTRYLSDPGWDAYEVRWRAATHYVLVEPAHQNKVRAKLKEKTEMAKLYKTVIDGKDAFGTLLARDSNGNLVLEIKGTGQPVAVKPENAEEVRPYTVALRFFGGTSAASQEYHYEADKGAVKAGDLLVLKTEAGYSLAVVSRIDTRSGKATKRLNGAVVRPVKLVGSLDSEEQDDDGAADYE